MPPRYPFSRNQPSSSSTTTTATTATTPTAGSDRPIVVSASGRAPNSPALALSANSPSQLRSRIPSPRNPPNHNNDVFENDTAYYPSPSVALSKGKSNGKAKKRKDGWIKVDADSPSKLVPIPRYDARGYPARDRPPDPKASPESSTSIYEPLTALRPSRSIDSLSSEVSSTGAGVNEETSRFLYPPGDAARVGTGFLSLNRPSSYYAPIDGASPNTLQPPTMSYALNQPSYSPYEVNPERMVDPCPVPTLYGDSKISLAASESSLTHFRKFDALSSGEAGYSNWSVTSKGGKRHIANMFQLPADPTSWSYLGPEADDDFHDPDVRVSKPVNFARSMFTLRGATNVGCLVLLAVVLVTLFAGYPVLDYELTSHETSLGAYNLGGINLTGQVPDITNMFQLIDKDTPSSAYSYTSMETGDTWELIFSDEFNNDGRTFYDGDDPYWEAVDLHYWSTNNLEWYDPRQITTSDGYLKITLSNQTSHNLNYTGGMMSTWNRFCFTGGYVEASVSLPGTSDVYGLWPAIWALGNLGRAGYGATLDGMWPYTYDTCDVGTLPNQTLNGLPESSLTDGDPTYNNSLSYLPGQRLSACTCPGDTNHPGPTLANGSFVGRGSPEIDMFEATVDSTTLIGAVSQSGQWAPFNPHYEFLNTSTDYYEIYDDDITEINSYKGGVYQQATSGISTTDQNCYTQDTGCFSTYGFEYSPGADGYISWVNNGTKAWTVRAACPCLIVHVVTYTFVVEERFSSLNEDTSRSTNADEVVAMGPNSEAEVGQRLVSEEPMYLIMNLGLSENFGAIDYDGLASLWPVHMAVDYIRVYQDPNQRNLGCDPAGYPTAAYIAAHADAYANPNLTVWDDVDSSVKPKNWLVDTC